MKITKVDVFRIESGINAPVGCRIYTDEGIYNSIKTFNGDCGKVPAQSPLNVFIQTTNSALNFSAETYVPEDNST